MKKTLVLLAVAVMSLWVSAQARETVGFNDFFTYSSDDGCYQFIETQDIISNLKSKGYELISSSKVKDYVYDEDQDDWVEALVPMNTFSNNGINISFVNNNFKEIEFSNKSELNDFLKEMKAKGWEGEDNIYGWDGFNYGQPIMATIEGLKIIFDSGE